MNNSNNVYYLKQIDYNKNAIYEKLKDLDIFQIIKPGMTVLLKPNFIKESHQYKKNSWIQIITNGSILYATTKVVIEHLKNSGKIIIADGPDFGANINKITKLTDIESIYSLCKKNNIIFEFIDLRDNYLKIIGEIKIYKKNLPGDPDGSVIFNIKKENSEFFGHKNFNMKYWGADLDIDEVNRAHNGVDNLYKVSKSVLNSDVFINLPKLKTHKKAGITCSLKNLVGINTYRNFLPHHTQGFPENGGDQFPQKSKKSDIEQKYVTFIKTKILPIPILNLLFIPIKKITRRYFGDTREVIRSGNWYGNDTIWRTILDLNKIIMYGDDNGILHDKPIRHYISIIDGIVGGEGQGPLSAEPINSNCIIAGVNPLAVDCVCAKIMGFDYKKIPSLKNGFKIKNYPISNFQFNDINVLSDIKKFNNKLLDIDIQDTHKFTPHFGWKDHIELES